MKAQVVNADVHEREQPRHGGADPTCALDKALVLLDAFGEFVDAAGIAAADQVPHVCLELGEIGEDGFFEVVHDVWNYNA